MKFLYFLTVISIRVDNDFEMFYVDGLVGDGFSVKFDLKTGVYITLPKDVKNPIGLCGNNDGDPTSEYIHAVQRKGI